MLKFLRDKYTEIVKRVQKADETNIGPFTWNLTKGNLLINPKNYGIDSDKKGIIMNGGEDLLIRFDSGQVHIPLDQIDFGGYTLNELGGKGTVSSIVTPLKNLLPSKISKYIFIIFWIAELLKCIEEEDSKEGFENVKYTYDVVDYDSFSPS